MKKLNYLPPGPVHSKFVDLWIILPLCVLDLPAFHLFYKAKIYCKKIPLKHHFLNSHPLPTSQQTQSISRVPGHSKILGDLEMSKTCWTHFIVLGQGCLACALAVLFSLSSYFSPSPVTPPTLPLSFFLPSQACQCHPVALTGITQTC